MKITLFILGFILCLWTGVWGTMSFLEGKILFGIFWAILFGINLRSLVRLF